MDLLGNKKESKTNDELEKRVGEPRNLNCGN
jgi:hypothetical protein